MFIQPLPFMQSTQLNTGRHIQLPVLGEHIGKIIHR